MANDMFGKFKQTLNKGITTVSVTTSSTLEKTKIKTHINTLNSEINQMMTAVGTAVYMDWCKDGFAIESIQETLNLIKGKYEEIEKLNAELVEIDERDKKILGGTAPVAAAYTCPKCGTGYDAPVKFCRSCGTAMTAPEAAPAAEETEEPQA